MNANVNEDDARSSTEKQRHCQRFDSIETELLGQAGTEKGQGQGHVALAA